MRIAHALGGDVTKIFCIAAGIEVISPVSPMELDVVVSDAGQQAILEASEAIPKYCPLLTGELGSRAVNDFINCVNCKQSSTTRTAIYRPM